MALAPDGAVRLPCSLSRVQSVAEVTSGIFPDNILQFSPFDVGSIDGGVCVLMHDVNVELDAVNV